MTIAKGVRSIGLPSGTLLALWVLGGLLLALTTGCTAHTQIPGRDATKLLINMSQEEVFSVMGKPHAVETYPPLEFWLYRTDSDRSGTPTILPVGFANAHVTGWGLPYYENAIRASSDKTTPAAH
jgi:hypothetical protein